jgi:prevent-host-death family protein
MNYSVHQAKTQFSKLLDLVESGEDVIIIRRGKPVAKLIAAPQQPKPILGGMKGEISWLDGWELPMTGGEE